MTKELYLLNIQDPISLVQKIFDEHKLRHLPVVCDNEVVGMVDLNDLHLLNISEQTELVSRLTVEDFMHKNPSCIHEDEAIYDVAKQFTEAKTHAIPVINHEGIVGIVTTTDIIRFLMDFSACSTKDADVNYPKAQLR